MSVAVITTVRKYASIWYAIGAFATIVGTILVVLTASDPTANHSPRLMILILGTVIMAIAQHIDAPIRRRHVTLSFAAALFVVTLYIAFAHAGPTNFSTTGLYVGGVSVFLLIATGYTGNRRYGSR